MPPSSTAASPRRKAAKTVVDEPIITAETSVEDGLEANVPTPKEKKMEEREKKEKKQRRSSGGNNCLYFQVFILCFAGGTLAERFFNLYNSIEVASLCITQGASMAANNLQTYWSNKTAFATTEGRQSSGKDEMSDFESELLAAETLHEIKDENHESEEGSDEDIYNVRVSVDDLPTCLTPNTDRQHLYAKAPLPRPIINAGLPKVGINAQHYFFQCSNKFESANFRCKKTQVCAQCAKDAQNALQKAKASNITKSDMPKGILEKCGDYDVWIHMGASDLGGLCYFPQLQALEEFHEEAPHATFLLPFIDVKEYKKIAGDTVEKHWKKSKCQFFPSLEEQKEFATAKRKAHKTEALHLSPEPTIIEILELFLCQQVKRMRNFVAKYPSHTLVEYDLKGDDVGKVLGNLFDVHEMCWKL